MQMLILKLLNLNTGYADTGYCMRIMSLFSTLGSTLRKFALKFSQFPRYFNTTQIVLFQTDNKQIFIYFRGKNV